MTNPYNSKQQRKIGIDAMKYGTYKMGELGGDEANVLASMAPAYFQGLRNSASLLGPGGLQASIDLMRNQAMQSATQAGMQGAALARWGGLGSGGQEAAMSRAMALGQNQADQFAMDQYSPEGMLRRQQALGSLFQPQLLQQAWNLRQAHRATAPPPSQGGGLLGGILQTAGSLLPYALPGGGLANAVARGAIQRPDASNPFYR